MNGNDIVKLSLVLNKLLEQQAPDNQEKHKMMMVMYELETKLYDIKKKYGLNHLDNSIISQSAIDSFLRKIEKQKQTNFLGENKTYQFKEYLRGLDYQYWFMIFLLLKNNEILDEYLTLHQIIDRFIDRIKNESLKYEDIMIMASGATRCKTNLRFAVNSLRKAGLINYHNERHKQSWTLTYLGYFTAASFVYEPDKKRSEVFSKKVGRIQESSWIFDLDPFIMKRAFQLAMPDYFLRLINYLQMESLDLPMLKMGPEIFGDYREFFEREAESLGYRKTDKEFQMICERFLQEQNERYDLAEFMKELARKFNADEFFRKVMQLSNR